MLTIKKLSIVLFNKEYTYLVNIMILLLFLSLKTHTFKEFTRNLLVSLWKIRPKMTLFMAHFICWKVPILTLSIDRLTWWLQEQLGNLVINTIQEEELPEEIGWLDPR